MTDALFFFYLCIAVGVALRLTWDSRTYAIHGVGEAVGIVTLATVIGLLWPVAGVASVWRRL